MYFKFKRNTIIACLLITVVLLSSILTGCTNNEETKQKKYLQNYLEKKYGKEFVVDRSRYTGTKERYTFVAHEVKESIYFEIVRLNLDEEEIIYDHYATNQCEFTYTGIWKSKIKELFSNTVYLYHAIPSFETEYSDWLLKAKEITPDKYDVEYLLSHQKGKIDGFTYTFFVFVPDGTKDYKKIYEDLYKLVEDSKEKKVKYIGFGIYIFKESVMNDPEIGILYKNLDNGGDLDEFIYLACDRKFGIAIGDGGFEIDNIRTVEDLKKAYKFKILK